MDFFTRAGISALALLAGAAAPVSGAAPRASDAAFNRPQDVAQIAAVEATLNKETDVARALSRYAPDAIMVTVAAPGWSAGRDHIREVLVSRLAGVSRTEPHVDEINIATDGKLACAASVIRLAVERNDGQRVVSAIRQLDAYRKIGGRWLIVQQHISVPVDMASGLPLSGGPLGVARPLAWAPVAPSVPGSPQAARAEIRHWVEVNAVTPTVAAAMATYGPSDDLILFDVAAAREHRGRADLRAYLKTVLEGANTLDYRSPVLSIDTDGRLGMQVSQIDLKITGHDGKTQFISFRQSDCLRRIGRNWYPFFEMGSFPIDSASGKAIMAHPEAFTAR